MKRLILCIVLLVTASACKKDKGPEAPDNGGGGDTPATDPYACEADDDCVAVELECCDACNGGEQVGVHKAHVAEVEAGAAKASGCDGVACTKMACAPPVPACEAGKCVLRPGTFE